MDTQQQTITLIADPKVLAIPIIENGDPFVDLKDQAVIDYGPSPEIPNNTDYTKMRNMVYDRLIQAQSLLPQGIRFCLYECYRSLGLQKMLYETRYNKIQCQHPEWNDEQVFMETIKMVSPIINLDGTRNIPAHSTGGAIDIYLIDDNGDPLDMGIHPKDWMQDEQGVLSLTSSTHIPAQAQKNRQLMNHALNAAGFTNYPTEYWHWSYGDRYWAYHSGSPHAIYGGR